MVSRDSGDGDEGRKSSLQGTDAELSASWRSVVGSRESPAITHHSVVTGHCTLFARSRPSHRYITALNSNAMNTPFTSTLRRLSFESVRHQEKKTVSYGLLRCALRLCTARTSRGLFIANSVFAGILQHFSLANSEFSLIPNYSNLPPEAYRLNPPAPCLHPTLLPLIDGIGGEIHLRGHPAAQSLITVDMPQNLSLRYPLLFAIPPAPQSTHPYTAQCQIQELAQPSSILNRLVEFVGNQVTREFEPTKIYSKPNEKASGDVGKLRNVSIHAEYK
ncbi:hypothetical protein B0H14DRAFT_3127165 [Mycena olivaceomarginata]|nr:hypothetical protein B0H14DRAFT_3127165 [Mycena olivaceomarginata]